MRAVKKWRYYCDYCKKSGASKYHMERHEASCTMNPNRYCRMCDYSDGLRVPVEDLVAAIKNGKPDTALKRLQDLTNCPTCILAAIRQSKIQDGLFYLSDFDYAKEKNAFWRAVNADTWAVDSTYL